MERHKSHRQDLESYSYPGILMLMNSRSGSNVTGLVHLFLEFSFLCIRLSFMSLSSLCQLWLSLSFEQERYQMGINFFSVSFVVVILIFYQPGLTSDVLVFMGILLSFLLIFQPVNEIPNVITAIFLSSSYFPSSFSFYFQGHKPLSQNEEMKREMTRN